MKEKMALEQALGRAVQRFNRFRLALCSTGNHIITGCARLASYSNTIFSFIKLKNQPVKVGFGSFAAPF